MDRKYGRAWKRIRDEYIRDHPYCEKCGGIAEEVHHIKPLKEGGKYYKGNLMALCKHCHNMVHGI